MRRGAAPALAAGLVLADSSIVTLALPEILRELDTTVGKVAWVLIAFNLALALSAVPAARIARHIPRKAYVAGLLVFSLACLGCAAADSMKVLVAARVLQGVAGAFVVASALELLMDAVPERAVARWTAAGILGAAIGPAAGGILTETLSWEAMFALQAPVALIALAGGVGLPARAATSRIAGSRPPWAPLAALALISAALAGALFLVVLLLIEGWQHSPAKAAVTVTALPLAALLAPMLARGADVRARCAAGAILLAGGLAGLALLPDAGPLWTVPPQLLAGAGLGLSLGALTAAALPEDPGSAYDVAASWTIAARHVGVVAGLVLLTPVFTADLEEQQGPAQRAGLAELLDAPLPLGTKLILATRLNTQIEAADGRLPDLGPAFSAPVPPEQSQAVAQLRKDLDDQLDRAGTAAFARSFGVAAIFALLALFPIAALRRRPPA